MSQQHPEAAQNKLVVLMTQSTNCAKLWQPMYNYLAGGDMFIINSILCLDEHALCAQVQVLVYFVRLCSLLVSVYGYLGCYDSWQLQFT